VTLGALGGWVAEIAHLTRPDRVQWCTGSEDEWAQLLGRLVDSGTFVRLDPAIHPGSFWCGTDPGDAQDGAAPVQCGEARAGGVPGRPGMSPVRMRSTLSRVFRGCMAGRVMYVVPYCVGSPAGEPRFGVQITDSPYAVASLRIRTWMGDEAVARLRQGARLHTGVHSVEAPLAPGEQDAPWPCSKERLSAHFPEDDETWSYGSGHCGIPAADGPHDRGGAGAAHGGDLAAGRMRIARLTAEDGARAFVGLCPPGPGGIAGLAARRPFARRLEPIGGAVDWLAMGRDGRVRACSLERGPSGAAPGTGAATDPDAVAAIAKGHMLFLNVALTLAGDVWWEGRTDAPPPELLDWRGAEWTPASAGPAAHPLSRYYSMDRPPTAPGGGAVQQEDLREQALDAVILASAAGPGTWPLIVQARSWQHGAFLAAARAAGPAPLIEDGPAHETTGGAAAPGPPGPLPLGEWLSLAEGADPGLLPQVFLLNSTAAGVAGEGPAAAQAVGWAMRRILGAANGRHTPIGSVPGAGELDLSGLGLSAAQITALGDVDPERWQVEAEAIRRRLGLLDQAALRELREEVDILECLVAAFG